jgi:hypothetical protein
MVPKDKGRLARQVPVPLCGALRQSPAMLPNDRFSSLPKVSDATLSTETASGQIAAFLFSIEGAPYFFRSAEVTWPRWTPLRVYVTSHIRLRADSLRNPACLLNSLTLRLDPR